MEDWIKGLGEMDLFVWEFGKGFFFDYEMLKGVNEEDMVDLMRGFNEVEWLFELVLLDDVDEELFYDVELWLFGWWVGLLFIWFFDLRFNLKLDEIFIRNYGLYSCGDEVVSCWVKLINCCILFDFEW